MMEQGRCDNIYDFFFNFETPFLGSTLLVIRWDAAQLMKHLIKPTRSSHLKRGEKRNSYSR